MCKKSRVGKNVVNTDAKCDTHRKQQEKQKTQVAFAWTSSPPLPCPPPPHRAERQMPVEAGMCRKSRVGKNTVKTDAKCATHRKTPKTTMRNAEVNTFLHSAGTLFCYNTPQKPMRKQKQSSILGEESAKTRVSAHASKGIAPPRAAADATTA